MLASVDAVFVVVACAGAALVALGILLFGRVEGLGVSGLATFAVVLGVGVISTGVIGLVNGAGEPPITPMWAQIGFFFWAVSIVPWFLFTLAYTGRYTAPSLRVSVALVLPFVIPFFNFLWSVTGGQPNGIAIALSSIVFIYSLALGVFGSLLVVQATRSYVHLSTLDGVALAVTPVLVVLALNSVGNLQQAALILGPAVYAVSLVVGTASLWTVLWRRSVLDQTPAVETLGSRAIARQTDDLVFVVDAEGTVVECNPAVTDALGDDAETLLGTALSEALGVDIDTLRERETVSLETTAGTRRYDPQVSTISGRGTTDLGNVLSLRDVTDRQLREQRLTVLNRVLRHNLRNKIDVIRSHAEVLREDRPDRHVQTITDTADEISDLGNDARTIDRFVSDSTGTQTVDLVDVVTDRCTELEASGDHSIRLDCPGSAEVTTNRRALEAALASSIENAVEYADSTVSVSVERESDAYVVTIADDGPGIPDSEIAALDSGTETPLQHGTGLGLWQLKWAVTTLGGQLSIETTDGTTVRFTVPGAG